jgi:hypothetical protein
MKLCPKGHSLHRMHIDALSVQTAWEAHAEEFCAKGNDEVLESLRRLRRAAVERFVDHLATCEVCSGAEFRGPKAIDRLCR